MITNAAITIYNRRRSGRNSVLIPTVISEASWFYGRRAARGQFIDNEDSYQVRIPYGADTSGKPTAGSCKTSPCRKICRGSWQDGFYFLQQFQDLLVRFVDLRIADGRKIDAGCFFRSVSHCFRDDGHGDVLAVCQARPGMPGNIGRQFDR